MSRGFFGCMIMYISIILYGRETLVVGQLHGVWKTIFQHPGGSTQYQIGEFFSLS